MASAVGVEPRSSMVAPCWRARTASSAPRKAACGGRLRQKGTSRLLAARLRRRRMVCGDWDAAVCVGHVHNEHAKSGGTARSHFCDQRVDLCAGGVRLIGKVFNMAVFGAIPATQAWGVELQLCAIHCEKMQICVCSTSGAPRQSGSLALCQHRAPTSASSATPNPACCTPL